MPATFQLTQAQRDQLDQQGFLILRGHTEPARVDQLRQAIERMAQRGRDGEININFIDDEKKFPARTGGFLAPGRYDPAFGQWNDEDVIPVVEAILDAPVRHSLFGMLAAGAGQPYQQSWHRDLAPVGQPNEQKVLDWTTRHSVQINAPLQPGDQYLQVVPGSHRRPSTPEEIAATEKPPVEQNMPGGVIVQLEPGDVAFYNANLWHRGWNPTGGLRWTLHNAYIKQGTPVFSHETGQKVTFEDADFVNQLPPRTRALVDRYVDDYPAGDAPVLIDYITARTDAE